MKEESNKEKKAKRPYKKLEVGEKKMTGHFMICSQNVNSCPPGTQLLKSDGTCML